MSKFKREVDAISRLDAICGTWSKTKEFSNRIAPVIMEYIETVKEHGLDTKCGNFNYSNFGRCFNVQMGDKPEVRYNKITTFKA